MKTFKVFVPIFLVSVIIFSSLSSSVSAAENISDKVLRLHILANSDTSADQDMKLKLKNYFLENTSSLFIGKTVEENIKIATDNREYIENICNDFLKENNYNKTAKVTVTNEFFSTRVYDDFTLPAGNYNTVKIEIGEGEGHNWWCIVFPSVCLSACSSTLSEYLTEDEMELVQSGYTPKFKIIEIVEKIKDSLD
ncbi:MAG: stage II sporulation protein R [Eubacterium sp.]